MVPQQVNYVQGAEALFASMLGVDSTTGSEREFSLQLAHKLRTPANTLSTFEVGDGTLNLLFRWGEPRIYFCTHMDTVPPYIAPTFGSIHAGETLPDGRIAACDDTLITGRGSCDAKGQILSMFMACLRLEEEGCTDFGLLLLSGEETGSFGAKAYTRDCPGGELVVVGEPTDCRMASSSKGTKSFDVTIQGRSCHSGYPEHGRSAVETFLDIANLIRDHHFESDPSLGETTYNIGLLSSPNPQNILSPRVSFRIYFRTTPSSDSEVCSFMRSLESEDVHIVERGGDTPSTYMTFPGIETCTVAFGSDAPQLQKFKRKALYGPGSILVAHTDKEYVLLGDLRKATQDYIKMYKDFINLPQL